MQSTFQLLPAVSKFVIVSVVLCMTTGCQLLPHSLQPAQLRKLNRGPELGRDTYNFSIKDPAIPSEDTYVNDEISEAMNRALNDQYGSFNP